MEKIIKTPGPDKDGELRGHCYDGPGWHECSFWYHDKHISRCILFGPDGGVSKDASLSLRICDITYGVKYEGRP